MSDKHDSFCFAHADTHAEVQRYFPKFDYRLRDGLDLDYRRPTNVVGHQQRAFTCWWPIEKCGPLDLGLDLGSHRGLTPFCIHVDKWYDNRNAHPIYGGVIPTDVVADVSGDMSVFSPRTFNCIVSSHSLEHMPGPDADVIGLMLRWWSLLRQGGVLVLCVPDHQCVDVWAADKDHKSAWGHDDFKPRVLDTFMREAGAKLVEYNTLDNHYSFNVVLEKL